jgi:hypothetical protein
MEQRGTNESVVIQVMKEIYRPGNAKLLYKSMIETVVSGRGPKDMENLQALFSWCSLAKEPLSIYELLQIWEIGPSPITLKIEEEIQTRCKRCVIYKLPVRLEDGEEFQQGSNQISIQPRSFVSLLHWKIWTIFDHQGLQNLN